MENVIVDYLPEHQLYFEKLNRAWIEQYFWMEPVDVQVLQHPDKYILDKGGAILMAICKGEVAGTCALKYVAPGIFEFTKMAVDEKFRGHKIGRALVEASVAKAKSMGAEKVILYSNTILGTAINLYRKLGFIEAPVDGPYKRSNIKMELDLYPGTEKIIVRHAFVKDAATLASLGAETFYETFVSFNTVEDMDAYLKKNFTTSQLESELKDGDNTFLLAQQNEVAIGFAKLRKGQMPEGLNEKNNIELERLYVRKDFLGKKVGHLLMNASIELAYLGNFNVIWLGVWEHNPRAIAFYEKCGFTKFGTHDFLLGNDLQVDWMMKKDLVKKQNV